MNARVGKRSPFDSGSVVVVNVVNLAGHRLAAWVRHDDRKAGLDHLVGRYGDGFAQELGAVQQRVVRVDEKADYGILEARQLLIEFV